MAYSKMIEWNQFNMELIYTLFHAPAWDPVPYEPDGLYDRCLRNIRENKTIESLSSHDEYQWVRIASGQMQHVLLAKPNKVVERKEYINKRGRLSPYCTNVIKLEVFFYKSATIKGSFAITYGDKDNVIKPLKILSHNWQSKTNWQDIMSIRSNDLVCSICKLEGQSLVESPFAILPVDMLTCDEVMIKDIIE